MRKLCIFITVLLLLSYLACKKSGSGVEEKAPNRVELRVFVTESGTPTANYLVETVVLIRINSQWEEDGYVHRQWIPGTYEETQITGSDGMARFIFEDLTTTDDNSLTIQKITFTKSLTVVHIDSTEYVIPKGNTKILNYDF